MQVEYKRNLQNNYMIIGVTEEAEEEYCLHMAETNKIPGLLPFHSTRTDGKLYLQYEITSKQPLAQMYEKKHLSGEQLNIILTELADMLETVQGYLLNPAQILFDPQYIYVCAEKPSLQFCYLPEKEPEDTVQILAEFFLKHLDHEDTQAVETGYQFYQCVQEENISLKKILKELLHGKNTVLPEYKKIERKREEMNPETDADVNHPENQKIYEERSEDEEKEWNVYRITHKERRENLKRGKLDKLFQLIHPAILISTLFLFAAIEILYYYRWISLTEAGGLFFMLISVELLGNQLWRKRREKKEEQGFQWISEEEDAMYRILKKELYETEPDIKDYKSDEESFVQQEDPGETRYLGEQRTEPGLRLIPVVRKDPENRQYGHQEIVVRNERILIGKRKGESDVILDSPTVSRTHAFLERKDGNYYVCDLNSKNGTFCNGERLLPQEKRKIEQEDLISFAELEYRAVLYSESESA